MIKIATLIGCAIGDALGNPFEMKAATSPLLTKWDGLFKAGGTFWKGEAGQYTDDTLMTIALATSLIAEKGYDPEQIAQMYLEWYNSGNTRGIGTTTARALENLKLGATWQKVGSSWVIMVSRQPVMVLLCEPLLLGCIIAMIWSNYSA